jgi:enoyl-CoA hydratase/carnithine racemase
MLMNEVKIERGDGIMAIRLDRPERKNAITLAMYEALADALGAAAEDPAIRIVTLTGSAGVFTAGNDLGDFMQSPPTSPDAPVLRLIRAAATFPKILVAAVEGAAVGIGTTILLHCDLAIATPTAKFRMPFVDLALVPEAGSSLLFPRLVGRRLAGKHLLLGEPFTAQAALDYGLIGEVVPEDRLSERLDEIVAQLRAKPPAALLATKRLIAGSADLVLAQVETEAAAFVERLKSAEAKEAFSAFFEKRPPRFG